MFSATVAENRKLSSATKAICERSETRSTSRTSAPSSSTAPAVGVVEALASSATSDVLPEPVGPTSATVRPASTVRSTSVERVGDAVVAERDVAQLDPPVALGERLRVRRARDPRLAIEDLEEPVARRDRPLRHPERDPEHPHRQRQHHQVGVEGGELAEREVAVDHLDRRRRAGPRRSRCSAGSRSAGCRRRAAASSRSSGRRPGRPSAGSGRARARSRANALITRIPETLSSASAVSSAIRCWTSCSAGRESRL